MENITKKEIDKVVGKVIKEFRVKQGLIQEELAEKLNTSQKYISRIESGSSGLGDVILIKCLNELEITPNALYAEFMTNENIKKQIQISKDISMLPENKLDFLIDFIEILKKIPMGTENIGNK